MNKHLVFMVHGIGEQVAGETVDDFIGAARKELSLDSPVTHNTVCLAEPAPQGGTTNNQHSLYPCHIRRMAQDADTELVFAEVHWSDISPAPRGVIRTSLDLLRLVLGLGYLALDNVQNNVVDRNAYIQKLVPVFVWIFYALIAPLNALLFVGAVSLLLDPFVLSFSEQQLVPRLLLVALGGTVGYVCLLLSRKAQTYLTRTFFASLMVLGIATAVLGAVFAIFGTCLCPAPAKAIPEYLHGIDCFAGLSILALNAAWLFVVALLFVLVLVSLRGITGNLGDKRSIYLAVCAGMVLFWMTFTVAFWTVLTKFALELSATENPVVLTQVLGRHFDGAVTSLPYGVLAVLALIVAGLLVARKRGKLKDALAEDPDNPTASDIWYGRLILNPFLNLGLFISTLVLSFGVFYAFAEWLRKQGLEQAELAAIWDEEKNGLKCDQLNNWLFETACGLDALIDRFAPLTIAVVGLIGFALVNNHRFIATALGVARDIMVYMTRSERANPVDNNDSRYLLREKIQTRFTNTVEKMVAQEGIGEDDRITVVSHSQGTVVAALGLRDLAPPLPVKPTLITMGCPLTHIYGHYFGKCHQFTPQSNAGLQGWHNICRRDDFVGTWVAGHGTGASNDRVPAAGHTGYWTDGNVWEMLIDKGVF